MKLRMENVLASDDLPSIPEVAHRVLRLAQNASTDVDVLAAAVKADPAMAAKLLRTANSAFFGRQYKVTSIETAIPVLGATLIRTLVLGFSLTRQQTWQQLEETYRTVWRRALMQGVTAELLARRLENEDPDSYFVAGLIQDVGVLAILRTSPEEYVEEIFTSSTILDLASAEKRLLGFSHVDVSVRLCENWKLAPRTIEAISDHHGVVVWLRQDRRQTQLSKALKVASLCAHYLETSPGNPSHELRTALSRCFGIKDATLDDFLMELSERTREATKVFAVDMEEMPQPHEILGKARLAIEDIAIQSQLDAAAAKQEAINARDQLATVEDRSRYFEQEMFKDPLTGAHNRRLLETGLKAEVAVCIDESKPLGMLFLDIDNFKQLNDRCGHHQGDRALKDVVSVLKRSLRDDDLVIRYGGDEFIAILIGVPLDTLHRITERICQEIQDALNAITDQVTASVSVGGIHCPCEYLAELDIACLIHEVDRKMYQAKVQGGNQSQVVSLQDTDIVVWAEEGQALVSNGNGRAPVPLGQPLSHDAS